MNKVDFITYISDKHSTSKVDAGKVIDMFTTYNQVRFKVGQKMKNAVNKK